MSNTHGHLLGQATAYPSAYSPAVLEGVPRSRGREALLPSALWPHFGTDVWTLYEAAWLGPDGRPHVGVGELHVPCHSPHIVESKSLKLYMFSLNREPFVDREAFARRVCADVSQVVGAQVLWHWLDGEAWGGGLQNLGSGLGEAIDGAPFAPPTSLSDAAGQLAGDGPVVEETLYSELLRSLCPVTAQPDWATVVVRYTGARLGRDRLLRYIAAFYDHQGFHEQCVERIFLDLWRTNTLQKLTVFARYTRRGGIDINPLRSSEATWLPMGRTYRQ